jgi:hypothetical protein
MWAYTCQTFFLIFLDFVSLSVRKKGERVYVLKKKIMRRVFRTKEVKFLRNGRVNKQIHILRLLISIIRLINL